MTKVIPVYARPASAVLLIALMFSPGLVLANGLYVGGDYSQMQFDPGSGGATVKPDAAVLRVGGESGPLGLEVRGGVGLDSDTQEGVEYKPGNFYGGYLKLSAPLAASVRPYVIGGYTKVHSSVSYHSGPLSYTQHNTHDGGSWGAGLDIGLSTTLALNLEYMRYLDHDKTSLSGVSLGLRSAF